MNNLIRPRQAKVGDRVKCEASESKGTVYREGVIVEVAENHIVVAWDKGGTSVLTPPK